MASQVVNVSETYTTMIPPLEPVPKGLAKPADKLCDSCVALELTPQDFVVCPGEDDDSSERYNPDVERHFGLVKEVKEKSLHCPLCRLVLQVIGPDDPDDMEGVPLVVTFSWSRYSREGLQPREPFHIVREINVSTRGLLSSNGLPRCGTLTILANDAPTERKSFFSRVLKDQINFSMVRNWIRICDEHHQERCAGVHFELDAAGFTDVLDEIPCFRVIDVVDNCITTAPRNCKYVALSYVWGQIDPKSILRSLNDNIAQLEKPGALSLPEHYTKMPLTIRDAMFVVKELGMRYLWVDSLCIIQDDDGPGGSKLQLITKMAVVYGAAALTITAASGIDAIAGLPGVHIGPNRGQVIEEIRPGLRLVFSKYLGHYFSGSKYYSRGWTFQEEHFTKRNLIFIGGQVVYQCQITDECREDVVCEDQLVNDVDLSMRKQGIGSIHEVEDLISEYTRRSLTYETDIYHAFAATITIFRRVLNANLCHGISDVIFDWFLLWEPRALQKRRSIAPSWSWSGWVGQSSSEICGCYPSSVIQICRAQTERTWVIWYQRVAHGSHECVRVDSSKTPSAESAATKRMKERFAFDCTQAIPTPRKLTDAPVYIEDTHYSHPGSGFLQFWTISVKFDLEKAVAPIEYAEDDRLFGRSCAAIFGRGACDLGTIPVDPDWFAANVPGRHEFIVLCEKRTEQVKNVGDHDKEPGWKYMVMLINWRGGEQWAERVAIGAIGKEDLGKSLGEGPVWKEFVLG